MIAAKRKKHIAVSARRFLHISLLLSGGGLYTPGGLTAQTPNEPGLVGADSRLITLHVTVTDRAGAFVANIPQSAFKVTEDDTEQSVKDVRGEDGPVSMGLVIDHSASMLENRTLTVSALAMLVSKVGPQDELFVVNFDDDPYLDQSFTHDQQKLTKAFEKPTFRGGSAMRNAMSGAIDYLRTDARKDTKALVLVTDGDDDASAQTTLEQLLRKVRDTGVIIYTIGVLNQSTALEGRRAKLALNALAEFSGGFSFYPKDDSDLSDIVKAISGVHNDYLLRYAANPALNVASPNIRITIEGYRGLTVRTRIGH